MIKELIDRETLHDVTESFASLTGLATAVMDRDGDILADAGTQEICDRFHRIQPESCGLCLKSDSSLARKVDSDFPFVIYDCPHGMVDAAAPIKVDGTLVGMIVTGQFLVGEPDEEAFRRRAKKYGFDEEQYILALQKVPVISRERAETVLQFMARLAGIIANMGARHKRQEETNRALKAADEKYRMIFDNVGVSIWEEDFRPIADWFESKEKQGVTDFRAYFDEHPEALRETIRLIRVVDVNDHTLAMYGAESKEELIASLDRVFGEESLDAHREMLIDASIGKRFFTKEGMNRKLDGSLLNTLTTVTIPERMGEVAGLVTVTDITDRKRAEDEAKNHLHLMKTLLDTLPHPVYYKNREGIYLGCNKAFAEQIVGLSPHEIIGKSLYDLPHVIPRRFADIYKKYDDHLLCHPGVQIYETRVRTVTGETRDFLFSKATFSDAVSHVAGIVGVMLDITDRKETEKALHESEEKFRSLFETSKDAIGITAPDGTVLDANQAWLDLFGYTREEIIGEKIQPLYTDPSVREHVVRELEEKGFIRNYELRHLRKKGGTIDCLVSSTVLRGDEGETVYYQTFVQDITERKRLEEQLYQAQKMESVGRLAGGVAHDFNNLLTAIIGNADLALMMLTSSDPLVEEIQEIKTTAERATKLTRQLLAFSRRQIVKPRIMDINTVILDMGKMIRRLIGEDIELVTLLADDLWTIEADPGQIEQVLTNIAVNSRDAMENGGKLTVKTENVHVPATGSGRFAAMKPGEYVLVSVSDTGTGMSEEVRTHAFEPFFSTKEKGKGTGLGLATCYGIVKQNNGNIWIDSEPGERTTVNIYLPRKSGPVRDIKVSSVLDTLPRGTETVMVVEDEPAVRTMVSRILKSQGYTVMESINGEEAVRMIEVSGHGDIRLLITDVVMPRMGGKELARLVREHHPHIGVLFMSGYTDDSVLQDSEGGEEEHFIQKPFSPEVLVRKVRSVIDG